LVGEDFDILISTQMSLKNLILASSFWGFKPDASLNKIDFRAAEKTFSLLYRLSKVVKDKMIIQTNNPHIIACKRYINATRIIFISRNWLIGRIGLPAI